MPGPILIIDTADSDLLSIQRAREQLGPDFPAVLLRNPIEAPTLPQATAFADLAATASVVILRVLGGKAGWPGGFDLLVLRCQAAKVPLIVCPGHEEWDDVVLSSTVPAEDVRTAYSYILRGSIGNFRNLLAFLATRYLNHSTTYGAAQDLPWEGLYHPAYPDGITLQDYLAKHLHPTRPTLGLLFYRSYWLAGNLEFVDHLIAALENAGANVLPIFSYSLSHNPAGTEAAQRALTDYMLEPSGRPRVDLVINTMGHTMARVGDNGRSTGPDAPLNILGKLDVPVLQAVVSLGSRETWQKSAVGLGPLDTAMSIALPEFDGRIITLPISFKERSAGVESTLPHYVPADDRIDQLVRLALHWTRLRRKSNAEKRIAIILSNYPTKNARMGNAVGLDTPASVISLLHRLKAAGYIVSNIPKDGDALMFAIATRCSNDREFLTEEQLRLAVGHVTPAAYANWFGQIEQGVQTELRKAWGEGPGTVYLSDAGLAIAGLQFGNIFVGLQPPRGFGENPIAIYHSPDLPPTHHYLAYYRWLRDDFKADAIVHAGKHGTLEWLPGKGVGLSEACYPEVTLDSLPLFYPFIVNDPGEGTQAKRRAHATIIDHSIPAMTTADSYGDIARLEQLLDEHYRYQTLDPTKLQMLEAQIWDLVKEAQLHRDLAQDQKPTDFNAFIMAIDGYLCEIKDSQIKQGLHTLGETPADHYLAGLLSVLTRLDNGEIPSLRRALAEALGLDYSSLLDEPGLPVASGAAPIQLVALAAGAPLRNQGDPVEALELLCRSAYTKLADARFDPRQVPPTTKGLLGKPDAAVESTLSYVCETLYPALMRTGDELTNLLHGLEGGFVPPGPSGAPTRGMTNVFPTGRNFYSVDPKTVPSPSAWEVGQSLGEALLQKYRDEEGCWPEMVGTVVWGTSAMRTHGDDVAQILYLLGVRPLWQAESRRVRGIEIIPLGELGRPRIDVTVTISGFFRDAFPNLIALINEAVERVGALDEPSEMNFVAKHLREEAAAHPEAKQRSQYRVFGSKPGAYGMGILALLEEGRWKGDQDLAEVYTNWGGYAYTRTEHGVDARPEMKRRFKQINIAVKNQDNREHDIFDSDDYFQFHGGMIATVRALTGKNPRQFFGDNSDPSRSRVRDLHEEAKRVFRTRVLNPKWIDAMKLHGYKGAFEFAATVDYVFGYDATSQVIEDWMYERLAEAYALDPEMQRFFEKSNPWALRDIAQRLLEAIERGLWENRTLQSR